MNADQLLHHLGLIMGLPKLAFDERGCACLQFDEQTTVHLEKDADEGCLQLFAVLGPTPTTHREHLYQRLLQANLFGAETGGATLAVDEAHHEIVLCRTVWTEDLAGSSFERVVSQFVTAAEIWQAKLTTEVFNNTPGDRGEQSLDRFAIRG